MAQGWIFDIQRYAVNDGPGIRTTAFLKGCPLRCLWCDNPESQDMHPQLLHFENLCVRCYRCVAACPTGATTVNSDGAIEIDRDICTACGTCVEACLSDARAISGRAVTPTEVVDIVKSDSLFYRNSGGGVTASGGEPTHQPAFLMEFLSECQKAGLDTALDTCGYVRWEVLQEILENVDLVLFDIKHPDPARHKELTGVDNALILENVRRISDLGKPLIVRLPLVPGCNDSKEVLKDTAELLTRLNLVRVDIAPYHQLGIAKYQRLGRVYALDGVQPFKMEQIEAIRKCLEAYGLEVDIA
jgi:pyruvate formate lyase activating enzyme